MRLRRITSSWPTDRRKRRILWTLGIVNLLTLVATCAWFAGSGLHLETFWGGVLLTWILAVVILDIGGLIDVFTMDDPAAFSLEERVSILFGRQHGPAVDYAKRQLNT